MKRIIFFTALITVIAACNKEKKVVEKTWKDGSPKVEKFYSGNDTSKDLVKEVRYYENKKKQLEGEYKDNKRNGDWVYYFENGNKWSEGAFADGLDEGKRTVYFENGQIRYEGQYQKGKQVGIWKFYSESGKLLKEVDYD